jgi:hypothetical protein
MDELVDMYLPIFSKQAVKHCNELRRGRRPEPQPPLPDVPEDMDIH